MLVLSRKQNQSIVINDNIRITVVSIRGNQVRIGIEAPPSVPVFREELCDPLPVSDDQPAAGNRPRFQPARHGRNERRFHRTPLRER